MIGQLYVWPLRHCRHSLDRWNHRVSGDKTTLAGRSVGRSAFIERPSDGRGPCWLHCVLLDDSCEQPPRAVSMDERCDMNWCDVQSKPWPQSTARRRRIERFVCRRRQKPTKYQRFVPIHLCQLCRKSIMQLYYICVDLWINVCMDGRVISTRSMCLEGGAEGTVFQYILSYFYWPIAIKFSGKKMSLGEQTRTFKFKLLAQTCPVTFTLIHPHPNGCIGPHFGAIPICFELPPLLPPRWFPSLTSPC